MAFSVSSPAIVTASGANGPLPPGLELSGVGMLSNGCSSVLLSGEEWLLGAAHCAPAAGATVTFAAGATASISDVVYAPGWQPLRQVGVGDLALMRLASPPSGVKGYEIASPSLLGTTAVIAGYGAGGEGRTGATLPRGALRYGLNQYEAVLPETALARYAGRVMAFDFDDGSRLNSRFGSHGLGRAEAMLAPYDSGGPSFVLQQGKWRVGGIHVGIAQAYGSIFGGVGFDLQPGTYDEWIGIVTAVPAPLGDTLLWTAVGAVSLALRRRRSAVASC